MARQEPVDRDGDKIGKLEDVYVYVDVETDEPMFGSVKEGRLGRHLTFVPLGGITVGPDDLQVTVSKEQVKSAPNMEMEGEELVPDRRGGLLSSLPAQVHPAGLDERACSLAVRRSSATRRRQRLIGHPADTTSRSPASYSSSWRR